MINRAKAISCCLSLAFLLLVPMEAALAQQLPAFTPNELGVKARSGLLMDARTGQILYSFNERERMQPASLAKIMTFEIILESLRDGSLKPDTLVPISRSAWELALNNSLSNMFLQVGEKVRVDDLLRGLMVSSGNDAALALAEYRGGSEEMFVKMMNDRAAQLGLKDTLFRNSHGLFAPDQYTTAYDMALLARHITLSHPEAFKITSIKEFEHNGIKQPNWNKLVLMDPRVNGLKTGHLPQVGYHLVATAHEKGMDLIAVTMGTSSEEARVTETLKLLNYGFNNFVTLRLDWERRIPANLASYKGKESVLKIETAAPVDITVPRGREGDIQVKASLPPYVVAPVAKGQKVGEMTVSLNGRVIGSYDLVAAQELPRGSLFRVLWDSLRLMIKGFLKKA